MGKKSRDTAGYTSFGLLLDALCQKRNMSFRSLATASGLLPGYHTVISRACKNEIVPKREHILTWARVLQATADQRREMLQAFHYSDDGQDPEESLEARIQELESELEYQKRLNESLVEKLERAHTRIRELEGPDEENKEK